MTVDSLKSQRLMTELDEMNEIGFSRREEINPSVIVREEVEGIGEFLRLLGNCALAGGVMSLRNLDSARQG